MGGQRRRTYSRGHEEYAKEAENGTVSLVLENRSGEGERKGGEV